MMVYLLMRCGGLRDNLMSDVYLAFADKAAAEEQAQKRNDSLADYNPNGAKWWVEAMEVI